MKKVPILIINNTLIICIQNDLTDTAILELQNDILNKTYKTRVNGVIIDVSELDMIDVFLGKVISDTAKMVRLLGAEAVIVGMKPNIAITLIELGFEMPNVRTAIDIDNGLKILNKCEKYSSAKEPEVTELPGES
mgnify:CR=1 FL=1